MPKFISSILNPDYLHDESSFKGYADYLALPSNEEELQATLNWAQAEGLSITLQGSRTGLCGGSVPEGGVLLSFQSLNKIKNIKYENGCFSLIVEPGLTLQELQERIENKDIDQSVFSLEAKEVFSLFQKSKPFFFPPDPTEKTASLGGMVSCNASGAKGFRYGPTRNSVEALKLILFDGRSFMLERGKQKVCNYNFTIQFNDRTSLKGQLPVYSLPAVKNATGYFSGPEIDLLDLFIGQEGTLAILSELELKLLPKPAFEAGVIFFFTKQQALELVHKIKEKEKTDEKLVSAIEFFDEQALSLAKSFSNSSLSCQIPASEVALYLELEGDNEEKVLARLELFDSWLNCGFEVKTWLATESKGLLRLRQFRHCVPEAINHFVAQKACLYPEFTKLAADFAVPEGKLEQLLELYKLGFGQTGLDYTIFGHIGENHLHANLLALDLEDYKLGRKILEELAVEVVRLGGTVSAEHGIGKLKKDFLKIMYGEKVYTEMKKVKTIFDPAWRLNSGNLF